MTEQQIRLVKRSWAIFKKIDPALVADVFYSRLFALRPAYRKFFPADMTEQYRKLIDMIHHIVVHLDRMDGIRGEIRDLGRRHQRYGVQPADYAVVGDALHWTLERGLGRDWTGELQEAWIGCYRLLVGDMLPQPVLDSGSKEDPLP